MVGYENKFKTADVLAKCEEVCGFSRAPLWWFPHMECIMDIPFHVYISSSLVSRLREK